MLDTMRRLYPRGTANRGICVDADGATPGPDWVLVGRTASGFRPIERHDAALLQKRVLAADRDDDWLFRQCQRIADALDKGEVALAQIHGLYIPIGELDDRQLNRLAVARFAKAGFNPDQPRLPQGDPHGGEWTTGDGDSGPFDALDPKPLDALRLEPRDLAGLTEGNIHPRSLADLAITQPGDPFPTGGDIQPPQPPAQSTTMESGDTSPTSAARSRTTEPRSPDLLPLRYEMAPRSAPPTVGSAGNAGADGGTSTIGEGAAASRETPRIDAINSDYSIEELLFPAGKVLIARALEAGVFPGMGMP